MQEISSYREAFIAHMNSKVSVKEPENLYEPISYILNLGGKRLRPILVLMATEIFGEDYMPEKKHMKIQNDINNYQLNVLNQLYYSLKGKKSYLCKGNEALETLKVINKII